jgi:diguanylate cyclase (GGDEF)-like protein
MQYPGPDIPQLLWVVAYQMGLYALMWALSLVLLRESRDTRGAVAHWVLFMALLCLGLALAAGRGEPRFWWHYNGANAVTLVAFALMRRGTERFFALPARDAEQLLIQAPTLGLLVWLTPGAVDAPPRIVAVYVVQALILARMLWVIHPAMRHEFGRNTTLGILVPASLLVLAQLVLASLQVQAWPRPTEMHASTGANVAVMVTYISGAALFSFGFLTLVTRRLVMRLAQASMRDELTNLSNRRAMNEALQRLWARQRRSPAPLSALVIDLDNFKRVNDTQGHARGDEVLRRVAELLQAGLRAVDIVGRAGGEEFWVFLPDTPIEHALLLAERLRQRVADAALGTTLSVGVAAVRADDAQPMQVVERADAALYRAKEGGRNRIEAG